MYNVNLRVALQSKYGIYSPIMYRSNSLFSHSQCDKCPILQSYFPVRTVTQSFPLFFGSMLINLIAEEFLLPNFEI